MMVRVIYLFLLAAVLACLGPGTNAQEGITLTLNGVEYTNNSVVNITDIGTGSGALICTTTGLGCCTSIRGDDWHFPDGNAVQRTGTTYYRTRTIPNGPGGTVLLHRNSGATTTGVFRCYILGRGSIYVGIYNATTGSPNVTDLKYDSQSRTLTCTSTGGPATTVTWKKDGAVITLNDTYQQTQRVVDRVEGTYQTVLTINQSVCQNDIGGTYNCTVGNTRGESSMKMTVSGTLVPTLDINVTSGGGPFIAGQSYNLTCTVTLENATGSPTVEWLGPNNNPLHSGSDLTVGDTVRLNCSTYTTTLQFTALRTSHGGQYSCQATLGAINNTAAVNIIVLIPSPNVTVTSDQNSRIISVGTNLTLTCITKLPPEVDTNITVNINWKGPAGDVLSGSSTLIAGMPTRYQSILKVNVDQFGNYSCTATVNPDPPSSFVTANEGSATVTIVELLHNITIMDSGVPISGETYNLTCTVEANVPPTTVQWLYFSNGTAVTNGSNITVWAQRTTDSTTILTLSFNPLHTSHGGQYTCRSTTDTPPSTVNATRNVIVQGAGEGVRFSLNGTTYQNNSNVTLEDIGEGDDALLCITDQTACCRPPYTGEMGSAIGNWYFPNGTRVPSDNVNNTLQRDIYSTRGQMVVRLNRRRGGENGIYSCEIPDAMNVNQTISIGVRSASTELLHNINITSSGVPISGETYNLTCTVEANVLPTVQWLYSSNDTVVTNGSNITVVTQRTTGSTILTLSFNPLHTSHGGQYTCQSTTDTPPSTVDTTRNVTVKIVDCGTLTNPANGQVSTTAGTTFRQTATYSCNTGYNLVGSSTRTCQATESWSGSVPTCQTVDCGTLTNPANGQVTTTGTTFGQNATYSCNTGYNLVGSSTRTCQATESWSGSVPTCQSIQLILNGVQYTNNSVVDIMDIRTGAAALNCTTTRIGCCLSSDGSHWYFPDGSPVQRTGTTYYRTRTEPIVDGRAASGGTVRLHRNAGATTTGVFHCDIHDVSGKLQSIYVGIYTNTTGFPNVTNLVYDDQLITLTCNSTGGPATTVTWRRNGVEITLNATYQQTKRVVDPVEGTYQTVLTIDRSVSQSDIAGIYSCTVENARGKSSETVPVALPSAPTLMVVPLSSTSVNLTWTQPDGEIVDSYDISFSYQRPCDGFNHTNTTTVDNTTRQYTLTGLQEFSNYIVTVVAVNASGRSEESSVNVVTLPDGTVVPKLNVIISHDRGPITAGQTYNLTCTVTLENTTRSPTVGWLGPNNNPLHSGSGITVGDTVLVNCSTYTTTLHFTALRTSDGGQYSCQATLGAINNTVNITVLINLRVAIRRDVGPPTAGQSYNLTCTVTLRNITGSPTIEWLGPNNSTISNSSSVTVENVVMVNDSAYDRTLVFSNLHTSHGGQYTCRTVMGQASAMASTELSVQIPQPTVSITPNRTGVLYAGTPLTLTCSIQLNPAVDTTVMVTRMWSGPGVRNSSRVTVSNHLNRSAFLYNTTIEFIPLNTSDGGNYECEATVAPDPQSQFVIMSTTGNDTHSFTVQDLPGPEVIINSTGNTTAGEMYTLSCTATVVEDLVVVPILQWEYSNGSAVDGGPTLTLSTRATSANTTTYNLTFSPLQTSHGGEYTCRAIISISSISISSLNGSQFSGVVVEIPPPSVSVNSSSSAYAGTNFSLMCTIQLSTAVDTTVVINSTWCGPLGIPAGTRVVSTAPTGTGARYQTILMFRPLNTSDSGNYTCEATVSPSSESQFINASTARREIPIDVQALPRPEVVITPNGSTAAGGVYTLTCSATVVENLAVEPDIQWLYNGTTVGGTNITVGAVRMMGNVFTRNLTFNPLRTSHGGKYICNTTINVSAISLIGISNESSVDVTVQIPVNATIRHMAPTQNLSTGVNLTLNCTIRVDTAVDTKVVLNTSWTGPTPVFASDSQDRISVTSLTGSIPLYETSIFFSPLNITDSGTYVCQADVRPDPPSSFIVMNNDTATHTINVGGLVAPIVMITSEGDPTAGNTYTLVCRVSVVEGLVVDPNVVWLDSNGTTVSGVNITVGGPSFEGSVVTHNLTFSILHTSHGGEYTCQASISVSGISLSSNNLTHIAVQIPQPTVNVTPNRTGDLYAGTPLTLTCSIQLNPAVDTTVNVTGTWSGPGSQAVSNSSHVTVSNLLNMSAFLYETTIEFHPLSTTDTGNYTCEATLAPDPQSQFVMNTSGNGTHSVTVQALQVPVIYIHSSGASTAGQAYILICTATVVENLIVEPTLEWLDTDRRVVGGNDITVGSSVTTGTNTTLILTFDPLHTSHGGKYTCRASINISAISLSNSNDLDSDVVVQIPPATINVTTMQPTINGTNVTLTCTITLDSSVDTAVNASGTWLKSNNALTTFNTNCITVSDTQGIDRFTCQTFLQLEPLGNNSRDGGRYVCEATVTPFPESMYIRNISNNGSLPLSVQALPLPNVQFTPSTFAMTRQPYSLTCTVQVVQYLAAIPNVTWLDPDGSSLQNRNDITVGQPVRNGNITTLRLTVDQLAQSHAGSYTCRACISIDEAAIEGHCGRVMADITLSVAGKVLSLESIRNSDQSVRVLWNEPEVTNGTIVNYTVHVQKYQPMRGSRELKLVAVDPKFNQSIPTAMLTRLNNGTFMLNISEGLDPLVPYRVTVMAVNLAGPGEQETRNFFTREGAPSTAPGNVEVIRLNGTSMNVSWVPLNLVEAQGFVQSYIITYTQANSGSRRRRQAQTQQVDGNASFAIVGGLQPGVAYEVTVSGMTVQNGPVSAPQAVPTSPPPSSSPSPPPSSSPTGAIIAGVVVALVVAVIVIVVVVIAYFLYNSRRKGGASIKTKEMFEMTGKGKPEKSSSIRPLMSSIRNKKDESADENQADGAVDESAPIPVPSTEVTDRMKPISVISFRDHVQQMHAERDRGFEIEYQSLGSDPLASHEVAKLPFNRVKNRFANIFPYDYCRVKLKEIPGEEGSDYINASIMDGYNRKGAYIASQGPMPNTISDFWRMIWEKRLPNIVILTKCMEAGRRKCEQYWGDNIGDDFETPDNKLRITTTSVLPLADFDIRIFTVKSIENPDTEPLRVTQYHFTSWPDHGVPKFATSLTAFIRRVQKGHNKDDGYPLLVHCSAGVGRTGTFILLDSMLERIKAEDTVNVYEFLYNMRTKRVLMVQTQAQFIFIHDALDELITCGETDIPAAGLRVKVNRLRKTIPGKGITGFTEQFQLLEQVSRQPEEGDFSDAQEHYNREKNRYPDKLPYNMSRARLRPTAEDGSEYINASFVDGYKHRNAYIATQAPLKTTVNDFWRMIWEFKSKSIVMLCNMMEDNQETSYPYWPTKEEETIKYGKIIVTMQSKASYGDFIVRRFNLQEDKSQGSPTEGFQVTQFHHTEWPETGKPPAAGGLIEMIDLLMKTQMNTGNRAITVMCNDGVGRTGAFICVHSQLERLKTEGVVDIFQSIKSARIQRAGLVPHDDQYAFCHEVLADYVDKFENYANFKDMV